MIPLWVLAGGLAGSAVPTGQLPPPPPPPDSFEAMEPTTGEQRLVVKCEVQNLEILYRWQDRKNTVMSFRHWQKSLSPNELEQVNGWLRELRSPAVIMTWCNPFGADVIFQEAYTRLSGGRMRIRINYAYGKLSRVGA